MCVFGRCCFSPSTLAALCRYEQLGSKWLTLLQATAAQAKNKTSKSSGTSAPCCGARPSLISARPLLNRPALCAHDKRVILCINHAWCGCVATPASVLAATKRLGDLAETLKGTAVKGVTKTAEIVSSVGADSSGKTGGAAKAEGRGNVAGGGGGDGLDLDLEVDPVDLGPKISAGVFKQMADNKQKDSWKQRKAGMDSLKRVLDEDKMVRCAIHSAMMMQLGLICSAITPSSRILTPGLSVGCSLCPGFASLRVGGCSRAFCGIVSVRM